MKNHSYRCWAEVDLDAISNNIRNIKAFVGEKTKVMAVVKADAYGHGSVEVSKSLIENGADYLGVAFVDEAIELREAGIDTPILVLGYTLKEDVEKMVAYNVTPAIFHKESAKEFSRAAKKQGKTVKLHIKLDTGMNRVGFLCNGESLKEIEEINSFENIEIEGVFSHFSCADCESEEYTHSQAEKFISFVGELEKRGVKIPIKHICNSAGIINFPQYHFDMVRSGIITYGVKPSEFVDISPLKLMPAFTLKSRVIRVQEIAAGEKISYGGTFVSDENMKIAALSIGYADGYLRALSNNAVVVVNGQLAKVVGRICMDQCIIDVTSVNNITVEDEVVVAGGPADTLTSFDSLAELAGTINYELFCLVGKRVPRIYLKKG